MSSRTKAALVAMALALAFLLLPGVRGRFLEAGYRWIYVLVLSFCVSATATPIVRQLALRYGVLDQPDETRKATHARCSEGSGAFAPGRELGLGIRSRSARAILRGIPSEYSCSRKALP